MLGWAMPPSFLHNVNPLDVELFEDDVNFLQVHNDFIFGIINGFPSGDETVQGIGYFPTLEGLN